VLVVPTGPVTFEESLAQDLAELFSLLGRWLISAFNPAKPD
jgi:hypothetical protein